MTPGVSQILFNSPFNPYRLANNEAVYSLDGAAGDSTYIIDGSNRLQLLSDRSGSSSVNALVSAGGASNSVTASNKSVTGSQVFTFDAMLSTWTPASNVTIFSKTSGFNGCELLLLTTGVIRLRVGDGATITNYDTTTGMSAAANTRRTVVATYTDGASGSLVVAVDGVALGTSVATAKTLTNAATTATFLTTATIGVIYRTQVGSVYAMNPSLGSKLAGSFASGGDTYTVTTSGDLGVRISGARDLYQGTVTKQPVVSSSGGRNIATLDGVDDYMKAAGFTLAQPISVYFIGSQVAWNNNRNFIDGGAADSLLINQTSGGASPNIQLYAGSSGPNTNNLAVGTRGVVRGLFNGASSTIAINDGATSTGNPGTAAPAGITLGANSGGAAARSNISLCELIVRSVADGNETQVKIARYAMRKWGVS